MPQFKTREYLSEYNGMKSVIKTTYANGYVVYHTEEWAFVDEACSKGACKLNFADNEFGFFLHIFNSDNETVGVYKMTPRLRGFSAQQLADQHRRLFCCKCFNKDRNIWETYVDGKLVKATSYKEGCGLATILKDDKWSVVDRNNNYVIPPGKYDYIDGFDKCGLARVKLNGKEHIYDQSLSTKDRWGLIDVKGNEVLELKYDEIWAFYGKNRKTTRVKYSYVKLIGTSPIVFEDAYDFNLKSHSMNKIGYYVDGDFYEDEPEHDFSSQYSIWDALETPEAAGNIDYEW